MRTRATLEIDCVGLRLTVPQDVFAPSEPFLLANAITAEVQARDRVLDMGKSDLFESVAGRLTF